MPKKHTYEFVKQDFIQKGYIPKFDVYINKDTKLDYICPNGHQNSMSWGNWNQGYRCPNCAGNIKLTHEFVKQDFEKNNYILSSKEYVNKNTKLYYTCPNGHENSMTWSNWGQGYRCPDCAGKKKLTMEFIKQDFEEKGYILLSKEYTNAHTKLHYICSNGHEHVTTWANWQQGQRCPKCIEWGTSNFEKEVKQFITDNGQDIIENDRTLILNPKTNRYLELDILFPCKTKAIECNGVYWHNKTDAKKRDKIKQQRCKKLNIELLILNDKEWNNYQEKCKNKIINFIG